MAPLHLGAFQLGEQISKGGMGTVLKGNHVETGRAVAVKVLSGDRSDDPLFLRSFRHEVRAVAALDHPRIVTVYDFGLVPDQLAPQHDTLKPGAPWIAMEYAALGSLEGFPQVTQWRDLQSILFDILDGLAHAHARELVHRDLKPGNILLVPEGNIVRCKLSDFGIAHARGAASSTHEVFASAAGTPWYMAPEQIESQWRDYGPWTDLYALGALAYSLTCGHPPFSGSSAVEIARKQLYERPPPIRPNLTVPEGFDEWVQRLLEKEIGARYQRAADALWALRKISPDNPSGLRIPAARPPVLVDRGADTIPGPSPEVVEDVDTLLTTLTFDRGFDFDSFPSFEELTGPSAKMAISMPPVPEDWRPRRGRRQAVLSGAGLGLFGLREIPFVDRSEECDLIWSALRHVANRRIAQGIVLQGPGGVGKARLADWIARRAHEVGAAKVLVARHGPMSGGFDGIRRMLDHYTGCAGLDLERTYERLRHQLMADAIDPPEMVRYRAAALARFLRPEATSARVPPVRIAGTDELFSVFRGILERYSRSRPVILVLRDVQWSLSAVDLADRILASQDASPIPLLLLITVRDDLPEESERSAETLQRLSRRGNVVRRQLAPLDPESMAELIDGVVKLEPRLRDELVTASGGNPLFALQLIGHWIERDALRHTASGFENREGIEIPASPYELWLTRLRDAAEEFEGAQTLLSMEVAAAIGTEVDPFLWNAATDALGYDIPRGLVDMLSERGLARRSGDIWEFTHELLREALVDSAQRSGRASAQHAALARALEGAEGVDPKSRFARHLAQSGRYDRAVAAMVEVSEDLIEQGLFTQAELYIAEGERMLERSALCDNASERARLMRCRGVTLEAQGDLASAEAIFEELLELATTYGWTRLQIQALRGQYTVLQNQGQVEQAIAKLERALKLARRAHLATSVIAAGRSLGWMYKRRGDHLAARKLLEETIEIAETLESGGRRHAAISRAALAEVLRALGDLAGARAHVVSAVDELRQHGDRVGVGDALNVLAELERKSGNLHEAEQAYREAMESYDLAGHVSGDLVRSNLAVLFLQRGRPLDARALLERAVASFEANSMRYYLNFARFGLAEALAATADRAAWDELWVALESLDETFYEAEFAEIATRAASHWAASGDEERARQAIELGRRVLTDALDPDGRFEKEFRRIEGECS